jgi:hypothetical protein
MHSAKAEVHARRAEVMNVWKNTNNKTNETESVRVEFREKLNQVWLSKTKY